MILGPLRRMTGSHRCTLASREDNSNLKRYRKRACYKRVLTHRQEKSQKSCSLVPNRMDCI